MRMLPDEEHEGEDREVTAADQDKINTFSKLNRRLDEILDDIEEKKQTKEALEDVSNELELEDEDEVVPYQLQSAFIHLPVKEILALIEEKNGVLGTALDNLYTEADSCRSKMDDLKVGLYAKFGRSINLERDD